jgi:hypothetical protein
MCTSNVKDGGRSYPFLQAQRLQNMLLGPGKLVFLILNVFTEDVPGTYNTTAAYETTRVRQQHLKMRSETPSCTKLEARHALNRAAAEKPVEDKESVKASTNNTSRLEQYFEADDPIWKVLDDSDLEEGERQRLVSSRLRKRYGDEDCKPSRPKQAHVLSNTNDSAPIAGNRVRHVIIRPETRAGVSWRNKEVLARRRSSEELSKSLHTYDIRYDQVERRTKGGSTFGAEHAARTRELRRRSSIPGIGREVGTYAVLRCAVVTRATGLCSVQAARVSEHAARGSFLGPQLQPVWAPEVTLEDGSRLRPLHDNSAVSFLRPSLACKRVPAPEMRPASAPPAVEVIREYSRRCPECACAGTERRATVRITTSSYTGRTKSRAKRGTLSGVHWEGYHDCYLQRNKDGAQQSNRCVWYISSPCALRNLYQWEGRGARGV